MKKVVFIATFILLLNLFDSANSLSLPKAGSKCPKIGAIQVYKGLKFTCIRSGNKFVWNKGVPIGKPSTDSKILLTDIDKFGASSRCKLKELTTDQRVVSTGFPLSSDLAGMTNINVLGLYVDFPDLQGKTEPIIDSKPIIEEINRFYKTSSYNKLNLKWTIPNKYFRVSQNVNFYHFSLNDMNSKLPGYENIFKFPQDVIDSADSEIDFSNFNALIIFTPPQASTEQIGDVSPGDIQGQIGYVSNDGPVRNIRTYVGAWRSPSWSDPRLGDEYIWRGLAHEFGHLLGLPDYYLLDFVNRFDSYVGQFDLMGVPQYGQAPELFGWTRWLASWLPDKQVICNELPNAYISISAIESLDVGTKLVIIPISEITALGIESRRAIGYDAKMSKVSEGVLIYKIDTSKASQKGPIKVQSIRPNPQGKWADESNLFKDAPLKIGETFTEGNTEIKVISSTKFSDVIQIRKN